MEVAGGAPRASGRRTGAARLLAGPRLVTLAAATAYLAALDYSYQLMFGALAVPYYALQPPTLSRAKLAESVVMLAIVVLLGVFERRPSAIFVWALVLIAFVPQLTIYALRDADRSFMWATTGFWVLVWAVIRLFPNLRLRRPARLRAAGWAPAIGLYLLLSLLCVAVMIRSLGVSGLLHNVPAAGFDLSGAYDNRARFVGSHLPAKGIYFHWLALVFNPAFLVIAVVRRRWLWVVPIVGFELLLASVVGLRSYYFALPFALALGLVAGARRPPIWLAAGLGAVSAAGALTYLLTGKSIVYLFFTGRFLLDAAQLAFAYFQFFSAHGSIPFAYAIKFYLYMPYPGHYPYGASPDLVIGNWYFGHPNQAAVAGVVADGFMNLGFAGMALWALLLGIIARAFDLVADHVDLRFVLAIAAMAVIGITDTYLVRVLGSTGLVVAVLLLYLMPRPAPMAAADPQPEAVKRPLPAPASARPEAVR